MNCPKIINSGRTSEQILEIVKSSTEPSYTITTEANPDEELRKEVPEVTFISSEAIKTVFLDNLGLDDTNR